MTVLIDSTELDSGEALSPEFRGLARAEIDAFKVALKERAGQSAADKITDEDLLREVMNTVGKPGRLGEQVRLEQHEIDGLEELCDSMQNTRVKLLIGTTIPLGSTTKLEPLKTTGRSSSRFGWPILLIQGLRLQTKLWDGRPLDLIGRTTQM